MQAMSLQAVPSAADDTQGKRERKVEAEPKSSVSRLPFLH
jgi:hypothetical protein